MNESPEQQLPRIETEQTDAIIIQLSDHLPQNANTSDKQETATSEVNEQAVEFAKLIMSDDGVRTAVIEAVNNYMNPPKIDKAQLSEPAVVSETAAEPELVKRNFVPATIEKPRPYHVKRATYVPFVDPIADLLNDTEKLTRQLIVKANELNAKFGEFDSAPVYAAAYVMMQETAVKAKPLADATVEFMGDMIHKAEKRLNEVPRKQRRVILGSAAVALCFMGTVSTPQNEPKPVVKPATIVTETELSQSPTSDKGVLNPIGLRGLK